MAGKKVVGIYDTFDISEIVRTHFPPAGWYMDVAIRPISNEEWEVEWTDAMTTGTWVQWEPDVFVFSVKNDTHNIPGYPEEWGDTEEEALENLCDDIAESIVNAYREWEKEKMAA